MRRRRPPFEYDRIQILLHWGVVALVIAQYATSGAIVRSHGPRLIGQRPEPFDLVLHTAHNRVGLLLVAVMVGRLGYRIFAGATPSGDAAKNPLAVRAAAFVHGAFYFVLIAEGVTGAIASYFWWPISAAHVILFKMLLALVAAHLSAVVWRSLVLRDGAMRRMAIR